MPGLVSTLRASVLFMALVIVASLPGVAVDWLLASSIGSERARPADRSSLDVYDYLQTVPPTPLPAEEEPPREYDIRGNEILRPVERYGVDHRGTLYELHSPQTEIPRLGPPEL